MSQHDRVLSATLTVYRRCIYFLDPDDIVPPSVSVPPAPLVSRTRNNSLSKSELEPVILEPPVTTNPLLCRPTLPQSDIATIRRLSSRVNVLPVVARADQLTNDRLSAVKLAVRRDLAAAGIGFGIFDTEIFSQYGAEVPDVVVPKLSPEQGSYFNGHVNNPGSATGSPPSTPLTPSLLRLPFALISPDIYSHSDGVTRSSPARHELVHQYAPSNLNGQLRPLSKIVPGKWVRNYRWGSLDCMDPNHSDFVLLREAIFFHMKVRLVCGLSPGLMLIDMLLHGLSSTLCPFHQIIRFPSHLTDATEVHQGIPVRKVQSRLPAPDPGVITINIAFPAFTYSEPSSASSSRFPPYSRYRHRSHTNYE